MLQIDQIVIGRGIQVSYRGWITEINKMEEGEAAEVFVKLQVFEKEEVNTATPVIIKAMEEKVVPLENIDIIPDFTFDQLSKEEQTDFALFFQDKEWLKEIVQ